MEPSIVLDGNPRRKFGVWPQRISSESLHVDSHFDDGKRFQDDLTEIQVAKSCCWGLILIDGNLPCFFERGKASLRKSGIRSTMPWRSRRSSIANYEIWSIARCLCLGVDDSFPWVCTGWKADSPSCWDWKWGKWIKPWNWHWSFSGGMWLRHIWRIRKNTSSVSELECLTLGVPLSKNVSHGLILFMYCIFWGFLVFVRMLNTLVNNLFSKLFIEEVEEYLEPMKVVGLSLPCFCVENHQINLAQVATGSLICVGSWRLWTRCVGRFLDGLGWNWTPNRVWLLI